VLHTAQIDERFNFNSTNVADFPVANVRPLVRARKARGPPMTEQTFMP